METTTAVLERAVAAKSAVMRADDALKNKALCLAADFLIRDTEKILQANATDVEKARSTISEVMLDRLTLTAERIAAMADAVRAVAQLPDPVGRTIEKMTRPDGLEISKVSVPFGVIGIIFESRPNVTSDAAALTLKSGNVCVLRGGKESICSNMAIAAAFRDALQTVGLPENAVNLIEDTSRESANELMTAVGKVDLLIPRGGAGLIRACVENAKVPCIQTGTGICHVYVESTADLTRAVDIIENAKASRPSVCNAAEVCLVDRKIADAFLPMLYDRLVTERKNAGKPSVELRLDEAAQKIIAGTPAGENDFDTEFLDYILAVKTVDGVEEAVRHIAAHSTGHSESILTKDPAAADYFTASVDSAAVYVNASTRFTDGGEFGLGCEIGISTQKMHARGPMGLREMTTYKYIVRGNGQIR
ncbi:MAG: glutamate-5-semialdehyde dehydrogenase [Clostridia bacterium]|nr:glutamate-5-semialdehyde dehydrogenase [Clostridia bacterium]